MPSFLTVLRFCQKACWRHHLSFTRPLKIVLLAADRVEMTGFTFKTIYKQEKVKPRVREIFPVYSQILLTGLGVSLKHE